MVEGQDHRQLLKRSLRGAKTKSSGKILLRKRDVRSIRTASVLGTWFNGKTSRNG